MTEVEAPVPVTAIVLTLNEESNITRCLDCLRRADDVVIVDSFSSDGTLAAACRARPDIRVFKHRFENFGDQRNWALGHTAPAHDWILFVDADEFCTDILMDEVNRFIARPGAMVGAYISGRNYFLGRWLKYSTMYPFYQLRLLKLGCVTFEKSGHGQREVVDGGAAYLQASWRHEPFSKGVTGWIERHNKYSSEESLLMLELEREPMAWRRVLASDPVLRRREMKKLSARVPLRPLLRFLYLYILKRGFLDGYAGLIYCSMVMANQIHLSAKIAEQRTGTEDASG